jgi:UDP:flavonoid glycosyltransferase YjiC (YdhE family)
MKLYVFLASGTRGDVQPYLALAQGLQRAGQRAVIATHANFRVLVESHGVEFRLLDGNPNDLFDRPDTKSALALNSNLAQTIRGSLQFLRQARPLYNRMLHSAWQVSQDAQAIIVGLPTLWGLGIAQKLNVPCFACLLQPLTRTRAYPTVFQPFQFSFAPYNYLTHLLLEQITWLGWSDLINAWRREIGLSSTNGLFAPLYQQRIPFLYGFSPRVFQPPADWHKAHTLTGYWFLDRPRGWTPPSDLIKFIESSGTPPLFMGFGSMGQSDSSNTLRILTTALTRTNARAVIAFNDSFQGNSDLPSNIFPVTDVPHDPADERSDSSWRYRHNRSQFACWCANRYQPGSG